MQHFLMILPNWIQPYYAALFDDFAELKSNYVSACIMVT